MNSTLPELTLPQAQQFLRVLEVGRYRGNLLDAQLPITATDAEVLDMVTHAVAAIHAQLSDRQKPVFAFRLTGTTFREIGKRLGISGSRVSHHYYRAIHSDAAIAQRAVLGALYLVEDLKGLDRQQLDVLGRLADTFSTVCAEAFTCHCGHAREDHVRAFNADPHDFAGMCHGMRGRERFCPCTEYAWHGDARPVRKLWLNLAPPIPGWGWVHFQTADEAIACLRTGTVTHLALDHAPGVDTPKGSGRVDGVRVLQWLSTAVVDGTLDRVPFRIVTSASDPELRVRMCGLVDRLRAAGHAICSG